MTFPTTGQRFSSEDPLSGIQPSTPHGPSPTAPAQQQGTVQTDSGARGVHRPPSETLREMSEHVTDFTRGVFTSLSEQLQTAHTHLGAAKQTVVTHLQQKIGETMQDLKEGYPEVSPDKRETTTSEISKSEIPYDLEQGLRRDNKKALRGVRSGIIHAPDHARKGMVTAKNNTIILATRTQSAIAHSTAFQSAKAEVKGTVKRTMSLMPTSDKEKFADYKSRIESNLKEYNTNLSQMNLKGAAINTMELKKLDKKLHKLLNNQSNPGGSSDLKSQIKAKLDELSNDENYTSKLLDQSQETQINNLVSKGNTDLLSTNIQSANKAIASGRTQAPEIGSGTAAKMLHNYQQSKATNWEALLQLTEKTEIYVKGTPVLTEANKTAKSHMALLVTNLKQVQAEIESLPKPSIEDLEIISDLENIAEYSLRLETVCTRLSEIAKEPSCDKALLANDMKNFAIALHCLSHEVHLVMEAQAAVGRAPLQNSVDYTEFVTTLLDSRQEQLQDHFLLAYRESIGKPFFTGLTTTDESARLFQFLNNTFNDPTTTLHQKTQIMELAKNWTANPVLNEGDYRTSAETKIQLENLLKSASTSIYPQLQQTSVEISDLLEVTPTANERPTDGSIDLSEMLAKVSTMPIAEREQAAAKLASDLSMRTASIFADIRPSELVNINWEKPGKGPNIQELIDHSNQLAFYFKTVILHQPNIANAINLIKFLREVQQHLINGDEATTARPSDLVTAMAIDNALGRQIDTLLERSKEHPALQNYTGSPEIFTAQSGNYGQLNSYTQKLNEEAAPVIPLIHRYLTQTTNAQEMNKVNDDGNLNLLRMSATAKINKDLFDYQAQVHPTPSQLTTKLNTTLRAYKKKETDIATKLSEINQTALDALQEEINKATGRAKEQLQARRNERTEIFSLSTQIKLKTAQRETEHNDSQKIQLEKEIAELQEQLNKKIASEVTNEINIELDLLRDNLAPKP